MPTVFSIFFITKIRDILKHFVLFISQYKLTLKIDMYLDSVSLNTTDHSYRWTKIRAVLDKQVIVNRI